jgi:hypothetical protein
MGPMESFSILTSIAVVFWFVWFVVYANRGFS